MTPITISTDKKVSICKERKPTFPDLRIWTSNGQSMAELPDGRMEVSV